MFWGRVDIRATGTLGSLDGLLRQLWKAPNKSGDIACFILIGDEAA
jgi:hypothetical protein